MMKDKNYKIRLIEHCIVLQEQALTNIRKVMEEVEEEVAGYGPPKDRYDGFRNQQARRRSLYARQMEQAAVNLQMLRGIDPDRNFDEVAFGALVLTNDTPFLVAVGLGLIRFEDEDVAVVSVVVPVFHAMKGKKAGENFGFNQKNYKILGIV
ncbi:MAG: hypothetical protein KG029_02790 [Bacteroidetes bacterium]|nr:hypothetical protein [Bacteroidota bacterium]